LYLCRNSATTTIEQELKFVGTETGKLLAVRDIISKVGDKKFDLKANVHE
jgi:hypothetical protein